MQGTVTKSNGSPTQAEQLADTHAAGHIVTTQKPGQAQNHAPNFESGAKDTDIAAMLQRH